MFFVDCRGAAANILLLDKISGDLQKHEVMMGAIFLLFPDSTILTGDNWAFAMASPLAVSAEQLKSHNAGAQPLCLAELGKGGLPALGLLHHRLSLSRQ